MFWDIDVDTLTDDLNKKKEIVLWEEYDLEKQNERPTRIMHTSESCTDQMIIQNVVSTGTLPTTIVITLLFCLILSRNFDSIKSDYKP